MVIAIDGPAGAGKSTVARAVAKKLGFTYLDSGAMYRAIALSVLRKPGVAAERAAELEVPLSADVLTAIRTPEVTAEASRVAQDPGVRAALVEKQRELIATGDWVAEGRDIGTVVAPGAELKVFLIADPHERARRRAAELGTDIDTVLRDQALRDEQDRSREHSPLEPAADSVEVDTTGLSIEEVVERIGELAHERR
jgi:cytidylate kinase